MGQGPIGTFHLALYQAASKKISEKRARTGVPSGMAVKDIRLI